jgi:hypothetical protein
MKKTALVALTLVVCAGMAFASTSSLVTNNIKVVIDEKDAAITHSHLTPGLPVGGEDIATATVVGGLPYVDAGNTGLFLNDYDEVCPFSGSTSPDAVYAYTPTADINVDISLCSEGNQYDTKLYVYANTAGNVVACNDDFCGNSWTSFASFIECVTLTADNTYYIVVDGYGGASGAYELSISECFPPEPCDAVCPPGAMAEGEPDCGTDYNDMYNGGCNSTPYVFTDVPCDHNPKVICGTAGTFLFQGLSYRDTDWYRISWPGGLLTACICGPFDVAVGILDAICPVVSTYCFETGPPNEDLCCAVDLPPGNYVIFAGPATFAGVPCGTPYVLTINGCPGTATENSTWGGLKGLFH